MSRHRLWMLPLGLAVMALPAGQAASREKSPAATDERTEPAGVSHAKDAHGFHYTDAHGMTLYSLDQRVALTRSNGKPPYCIGPCAQVWTEYGAPADAGPVGRWKVVAGARGPQWAYKDRPVFTFVADKQPGDMAGDQYEDLWATIAYVPPAPAIQAPPMIVPLYVAGAYVLATGEGRVLFVPVGAAACGDACATWSPLLAGMASRDIGEWSVSRDGEAAHWLYRGKPVFMSGQAAPTSVPAQGQMLKP